MLAGCIKSNDKANAPETTNKSVDSTSANGSKQASDYYDKVLRVKSEDGKVKGQISIQKTNEEGLKKFPLKISYFYIITDNFSKKQGAEDGHYGYYLIGYQNGSDKGQLGDIYCNKDNYPNILDIESSTDLSTEIYPYDCVPTLQMNETTTNMFHTMFATYISESEIDTFYDKLLEDKDFRIYDSTHLVKHAQEGGYDSWGPEYDDIAKEGELLSTYNLEIE